MGVGAMSKLSAEPIMTQMTIWDLMKESLDELTSEQMVSRIGDTRLSNLSVPLVEWDITTRAICIQSNGIVEHMSRCRWT
jgi:hypothetical protein